MAEEAVAYWAPGAAGVVGAGLLMVEACSNGGLARASMAPSESLSKLPWPQVDIIWATIALVNSLAAGARPLDVAELKWATLKPA